MSTQVLLYLSPVLPLHDVMTHDGRAILSTKSENKSCCYFLDLHTEACLNVSDALLGQTPDMPRSSSSQNDQWAWGKKA
ncbi:hypothetical protein BDV36DRAFT_262980, partial [Aspergillus pseudocaelatus]